jgi:drug/metabolite transporter (DMT)-like permease
MVYLGQRVRPIQWLFIGMALTGVVVVNGLDPNVPLMFVGIGTLSAFFASVAYLATIKCKATDHPVLIVMYFHLLATPLMGGFSFFNWVPIDGAELFTGLAVGVLSVFAQVAMAFAILREDASVVTPFKYIGAILAWIVGVVMFDEYLGVLGSLGIVIVVTGVVLNTLARRYKW